MQIPSASVMPDAASLPAAPEAARALGQHREGADLAEQSAVLAERRARQR